MEPYKKVQRKEKYIEKKLEKKYKQITEQIEKFKLTRKDNKPIINVVKETIYHCNLKLYRFTEDREVKRTSELVYDSIGTEYSLMKTAYGAEFTETELKEYERNRFYCINDDGMNFIKHFVNQMKRNNNFEVQTTMQHIGDYVKGFIIDYFGTEKIKYEVPRFTKINYKMEDDNIGIYSKYTKYTINEKAKSFKDLIAIERCKYLQKNYRANSCFLTCIINKFNSLFEMKKSDGTRRYKPLTYDFLCQFLHLTNTTTDIECSIEKALPFFERFGLGLFVYDMYLNLLFKYEPEKEKKNKNCYSALRVIVKDNHMYEMNNNVKSLEQVVHKEDDETDEIKVSKYFSVFKSDEEENVIVHMIKDIDDMTNLILKYTNKQKKQVKLKLITNKIDKLLIDAMKAGYSPKVNFHSDIYRLVFEFDYIFISVEKCDISAPDEPDIEIDNVEEYKNFNKANYQFYSSIIKNEYLSMIHPTVNIVEDKYKINASTGTFEQRQGTFTGLDENKAYTECLMNLTQIPVFNYFDVYRQYNNEPLEDYTYYIIEILEDVPKEYLILFTEKFTRTFGFVLKDIQLKYKIHYYRKPLNIVDVNFKSPVDEVYSNNKLSTQLKKDIVNRTIGQLGKKYNKAHITRFYKEFNHANFYKIKYFGKLFPIEINEDENKLPFAYGVNVFREERLVNGFCAINDIIKVKQNLKLSKLCRQMEDLNINVLGVRTDCLIHDTTDLIIESNFEVNNKIGCYKIETGKYLCDTILSIRNNDLIQFEDFENLEIKTFTDEYNTELINKYLKKNKKIFIKATYPGSGKSQAVKNYNDKTLFILPYNELALNLRNQGFEAITFHKFFGLDINDFQRNKSYDCSEIETVCFDECYLHEPKRLLYIDGFIRSHPNIQVIGVGDCDQAEPVGFDNIEYLNKCIDMIFPKQIHFTEIKRLRTEEDKKKMKELKKDIFNNMPFDEMVKKYNFNTVHHMKDVNTSINVSYLNNTVERVNNHVFNKVLKLPNKYNVGMKLKCRKYYKTSDKKITCNTNYTYTIDKISKTSMTLFDEYEDIKFEVPNKDINECFKLPYCSTIDSIQGVSFGEDDKITIFDLNTSYMSRRRVWTALTRARYLNNITLFVHTEDEKRISESCRYRQYFEMKINNYKKQDLLKKRVYDDKEYITSDWLFEQFQKSIQCKFCNKTFELYLNEDNKVISDISCDRIDNKISHLKNNCVLSCVNCNCSRK